MKLITLKNGTQVADVLVTTVMVSLLDLVKHDAISFYEVVQVARDPRHVPWDATRLRETGLVDGAGEMHDSTRHIILSAVQGDDAKMILESPVAPSAP